MEGTSQERSIFCKCKYDVGEEFSDSKSHWFFSPVDGTLRIYNLSLDKSKWKVQRICKWRLNMIWWKCFALQVYYYGIREFKATQVFLLAAFHYNRKYFTQYVDFSLFKGDRLWMKAMDVSCCFEKCLGFYLKKNRKCWWAAKCFWCDND